MPVKGIKRVQMNTRKVLANIAGRSGNQQQRQREKLGAFEFGMFFHGLRIEGYGGKVQKPPQHPPTKPHQYHPRRALYQPERTAELSLNRR